MNKILKPDITTEQSILDAAEKLFLEKGFALTSTVEIAREAKCNQALIHYYFRSKDRLFETVFKKKLSLFLSSFLQISSEDIPFEEKLRRKIELHFDMLMANPQLPFLLFNEIATNPERLLSMKQMLGGLAEAAFEQLKAELDAEVKKGTVKDMEPIELVILVISLNVVPFITRPIFSKLGIMSEDASAKLVERKKKQNVEFILKAIRP